jgi:hypothetical protein
LRRENLFPFHVSLELPWKAMLKAVEFHGQFGCRTIEIENVAPGWVLAAKLESGKTPCPQRVPKFLFFHGLLATKVAGVGCRIHVIDSKSIARQGNVARRRNVFRCQPTVAYASSPSPPFGMEERAGERRRVLI